MKKSQRSKSRCRKILSRKIKKNMAEYSKYSSRAQAIAVSYAQVRKSNPSCSRSLRRSRNPKVVRRRKSSRNVKRISRKVSRKGSKRRSNRRV